MEMWKPVKDYENEYEVSNLGRARSVTRWICNRPDNKRKKYLCVGRILKTIFDKKGYCYFMSSKNGVHKLMKIGREVAKAFIHNPENKPCINHKNGITADNRVENLEWCTYSENLLHSYRVLKRKSPPLNRGKFGFDNHLSKPVKQCSLDGKVIKIWGSSSFAANALKISQSSIRKCVTGYQKKPYKGFIWKTAI